MEEVSGSGSLPIFVACILAAVCILVLFSRKGGKKKTVKKAAPVQENGVPAGKEEDYRCGVDPCSCGMPVMYTLHTCRHCVRLKDFLDQHGIAHRLIYVDEFTDPARKQIMTTDRKSVV